MSRQNNLPPIKPRTGIVGIERSIQEKQRVTDANISQAFQDLSKLMAKAKEMVAISQSIANKIKEKQGGITEDETVQFKSYLLSLGIDDPVTRESYKSNDQYFTNLAKQIAEVLLVPLEEVGGMMTLTDAYCRINRARGLNLLSPDDLLAACKLMDQLDLPVVLRQFDSNVRILQLKTCDDEAIVAVTSDYLKENKMVTSSQLAQELGISLTLAHERLLTTEKSGYAVQEVDNQATSAENSRASTPISKCTQGSDPNASVSSEEPTKVRVYKFKDPKFQHNSIASKSPTKKKIWKSLKQIIAQERALPWGENFVHYMTINAPPSFKPAKKYSDISGLPAPYTDPQTKLYYSTPEEFQTIRSLPSDIISGYLVLRRANNPIP
ncbi:hypothetical protein RUM43_012946 [Polyplax serrata]|uniref:Vacuolar protein-sorting-associated protein 36 n=1 Tax=Polyplax serrata TaxID=468196 RepID=A0AAN8P5Q0_POLSC